MEVHNTSHLQRSAVSREAAEKFDRLTRAKDARATQLFGSGRCAFWNGTLRSLLQDLLYLGCRRCFIA